MSIKISEMSTYYVPIIYLFTLVLVNFNKSNLTYKPSGNNTNKIINLSKRRSFKYFTKEYSYFPGEYRFPIKKGIWFLYVSLSEEIFEKLVVKTNNMATVVKLMIDE